MKRHVGTALSVAGLLMLGIGAVTVNVRMLHDAGGEGAEFRTASDATPSATTTDDVDRPQLTAAQMALLRVAAMVRSDPATVRAVARGDRTQLLASVEEAARVVGISLNELASVAVLPSVRDRAHGAPDADDRPASASRTSTIKTYDD